MNLNLYTVKGDPTALMEVWDRVTADLGKDEFFLNVVARDDDGITIVDICPTEADFQGWINGDDWGRIQADLGGDVRVTRLGEVHTAIARDTVVEVVHAHTHV
jgi:hypothetical protein